MIPDRTSDNFQQFFLKGKTHSPVLMVNLQDESLKGYEHLKTLCDLDISLFRINCSFGDFGSWMKISKNLKELSSSKKNLQLLFDLTGRKVRIESIFNNKKDVLRTKLEKGKVIKIHNTTEVEFTDGIQIITNLMSSFTFCREGDIIRFDDSKITGHILKVNDDNISIEIDQIIGSESDLSIGKGINFPDRILPNTGLSEKDKNDIIFMMNHGNILCLSFTQNSEDILAVKEFILSKFDYLPPIVIKIETSQALENLDAIIDTAMTFPKVSLLVARGDLVSECGWENLAKAQEKIYLKAKSYNLPVILATGILEEFIQKGIPSRAEILDFHYANKFDCILINKGKYMYEVIDFCNNYFKS